MTSPRSKRRMKRIEEDSFFGPVTRDRPGRQKISDWNMISRNALLAETAKRRRAMKISRPHWKNYLSVLLLAVASLLLATATTTAFQVHQKDSSALLPLSKKNNGNIWHHEQRVVSPRYLFQRIEDETIEEVQKERLSSRIGNRMGSLKNRTMLKFSSRRSTAKKTADDVAVWVKDVHELRREVLQNKIPLKEIGFNLTTPHVNATTVTTDQLLHHSVIELIAERVRTNSTPGNRAPDDTAHLALAIEGGGMRGSVSAGMAAAIASLDLTDAFDSIYGSSAGCMVGAYMISRQMCVDVYTQIMPAAGTKFASQKRILGNVGVGYVSDLATRVRERSVMTLAAAAAAATKNVSAVPMVTVAEYANNNMSMATIDAAAIPGAKRRRFASSISTLSGKFTDRVPVLKKAPAMLSQLRPYLTLHPGMNLTFILDGIMSSTSGLRPFDMETFQQNDAQQPLYAVASTVRGGKMETVAFGSREGDFWDIWVEEQEIVEAEMERKIEKVKEKKTRIRRLFRGLVQPIVKGSRATKNLGQRLVGRAIIDVGSAEEEAPPTVALEKRLEGPIFPGIKAMDSLNFRRRGKRANYQPPKKRKMQLRQATECPGNSGRKGLFACLESSMLVPGAAGPPIKLLRSNHRKDVGDNGVANSTNICVDAFCYEAIPYRSAVANGATHVLVLRSRPDGCALETKPYSYEKIVAPVYFRRNGVPLMGEFFEKGGSQYRYVEDVMTLDEGLAEGCQPGSSKPVKVPPTDILFGTDDDNNIVVEPESWSEAHLLPVVCKAGTQETPTLTQEKAEVVDAVRAGYVAAFHMLAPIADLLFDPKDVDSSKIAEMLFPLTDEDDVNVLDMPIRVPGYKIQRFEQSQSEEQAERKRRRFAMWMNRKRDERTIWKKKVSRNPFRAAAVEVEKESPGMVGGKADKLDWLEAEALLAALPGFRSGKFPHLAGSVLSGQRQPASDTPASDAADDYYYKDA